MTDLLSQLSCPFCGTPLALEAGRTMAATDGTLRHGIATCECCAYPIVDGIPYLHTGAAAKAALAAVGQGLPDRARAALLGLDEAGQETFDAARTVGGLTYRHALALLPPAPEGDYLLHRFSDPTFLAVRALVRAIAQSSRTPPSRILDLCGGAGHVTRVLRSACPGAQVVLADLSFPKLWLAKRFVSPGCDAVCCDANVPLPFKRHSMSLAVCADAFHYIWCRRSLAAELMRLVGSSGTVVLAHLHNLLCENYSAGMPLSPAGYRRLFDDWEVGMFAEQDVRQSLPEPEVVDLSRPRAAESLATDGDLFLVATLQSGIFKAHDLRLPDLAGQLAVNPLYLRDSHDAHAYHLQFPSQGYEMEYGPLMDYLPRHVVLPADVLQAIADNHVSMPVRELMRQHVVLDLPADYL